MALGKYENEDGDAWAKDSEATIEVYDMTTREKTERTAKVYNLFAEIPAGAWVLLPAVDRPLPRAQMLRAGRLLRAAQDHAPDGQLLLPGALALHPRRLRDRRRRSL